MTDSIPPRLIIVMGVSGCGKSTVARNLAIALGALYLDADDYHPEANIAKMSRGEALQDEDRWPWLKHFAESMATESNVVIGACSALCKRYREAINNAAHEAVVFVYLNGSKSLIRERLKARQDHFMPDSLLDSQFATLEPPQADELALTIDINRSPDAITYAIIKALREIHHES